MFFKVETHSRARKPKPQFIQADDWGALILQVHLQAPGQFEESQKQWHTLKVRTISEAEYRRNVSPVR